RELRPRRRAGCRRNAERRPSTRLASGGRGGAALAAPAELTDLLDQVVTEGGRGGDLAIGRGLWNVVGGTERKRLQADLRVAARQRRRHDDDEVALLLQELGKRGQAVDIRHLDVED